MNCYILSSVSSFKSKLFNGMSYTNCCPSGRSNHVSPLKKPQPDTKVETPSLPLTLTFLEKDIIENAYLLLPALFGTGIAYLISLRSQSVQNLSDNYPELTKRGATQDFPNEYLSSTLKLIALAYVFGSISGIAMFIYRSLIGSVTKHPLNNLFFIGIGLASAILLFASVNLAMFVLFPTSFKGEVGKHWIEKAITFIYYSALGISVGPAGDILPTEITTRVLLALEGLVNLVIFSLLIASIFG